MDVCQGCGLDRDGIGPNEIIPRINSGLSDFCEVLSSESPELTRRPAPNVWSVLEYCAHIRDVLLNQREGLVVELVEDQPVKQRMYREERVNMGMYATETSHEVIQGIEGSGKTIRQHFRCPHPSAAIPNRHLFRYAAHLGMGGCPSRSRSGTSSR